MNLKKLPAYAKDNSESFCSDFKEKFTCNTHGKTCLWHCLSLVNWQNKERHSIKPNNHMWQKTGWLVNHIAIESTYNTKIIEESWDNPKVFRRMIKKIMCGETKTVSSSFYKFFLGTISKLIKTVNEVALSLRTTPTFNLKKSQNSSYILNCINRKQEKLLVWIKCHPI